MERREREWISTPPFFVSMQDENGIEYLERIGFGGLEAVEKKNEKTTCKISKMVYSMCVAEREFLFTQPKSKGVLP